MYILILLFILISVSILKLFVNNFTNVNKFNGYSKRAIIDNIVYINLDNRPDRNEKILNELKPFDNIHRISAVYTPNNGHKGCCQSHIKALELAKENNWDRVLILEDDALILKPKKFSKDMFKVFYDLQDKNWDVIVMCPNNTVYGKKHKYVSEINYATTAVAYIVNNHYYDTIIDLFKEADKKMPINKWSGGDREEFAIDQQWNKLIKKDNWYTPNNKIIGWNNYSRSTIMDKI